LRDRCGCVLLGGRNGDKELTSRGYLTGSVPTSIQPRTQQDRLRTGS
jgi:hypothetical protein